MKLTHFSHFEDIYVNAIKDNFGNGYNIFLTKGRDTFSGLTINYGKITLDSERWSRNEHNVMLVEVIMGNCFYRSR